MKSTERLTKFVKNPARLGNIRTRRLLRALSVHQRILINAFSNFFFKLVTSFYNKSLFLGHIWFWYKKRKTPDVPYGDCNSPVDARSVTFFWKVGRNLKECTVK